MLKGYPKAVVTKDGTSVLLRPLAREDEDNLRRLFELIPEKEQWFLRENLNDPELLHRWVERVDQDQVLSTVAVREENDEIIGNLRLYRSPSWCVRHVAHLRITIHPDFRHQKLGTWMILDCAKLAMDEGIEMLIAEFISGVEDVAVKAAKRLDFQQKAVIEDYVKDRSGSYLDLTIMVKNLYRDWSDF